jgi:hypothetical protein
MIKNNFFDIRFSKPNKLLLMLISSLVILNLYKINEPISLSLDKNIDAITFVFLLLITFSSPILDLLKNVFILTIWFSLCFIWYYDKSKSDFSTAILPISMLAYSQLTRIIFTISFGYQPIHLIINKYTKNKFSKSENRLSNSKDFYYSIIYSILGVGLFLSLATLSL